MKRCVILILLALVISACSGAPSPSPVRTATRVGVEEAARATMAARTPAARTPTAQAPASAARPSATPTPAPTSTHTRTATQSAAPPPSSTPASSSTPAPTVATRTRSQDGMSMVEVPAGDFTMGSPAGAGSDEEFPQHTVTLDGFWIDRTEVTNAQYRLFVAASGHLEPVSCGRDYPAYNDEALANHPVVCVSWDDAGAYCEWAGARLPTEAEWERAARGGDERTYPWGSSFDGSRLNFCDANCESPQKDTLADDGYARTAPVGSYPAGVSPYGALDMAGNVFEWVSDWYNFFYYAKSPPINPQGPKMGDDRVLRGGSWFGTFSNARSAFRAWLAPDKRDAAIGFRCVVGH